MVKGGLEGIDVLQKFLKLKMLIHAPSGHGKSTFLSSLADDPRTFPTLILDCDGGAGLRFAKKDPEKYTIKEIHSIDELSTIFNYLANTAHPYKSVAIDNLTFLQQMGLFEFANGKVNKPEDVKAWKDMKQAEIQHWGKSLNQMMGIVESFKSLPIHAFFTTLSNRHLDDIAKKSTISIKLPGQQADAITGIPNIVGFIDCVKQKDGKIQRILKLQPDGYDAKDQTGLLGAGLLIEETGAITKMLNLIEQGLGKKIF